METTSAQSPSLIFRPESYVHRLDLAELFPVAAPLHVELGSGDGSFLVEYAKQHSDQNFIGVERLLGRLRKIDRKGTRAGLVNLRLIRLEASYLVDFLLPQASVSAFHIYFPDPWPKRRHRKHRLIQDPFLPVLARALVPSGTVYLRTDDADYFQQMNSVFGASALFAPVNTPQDLAAVLTDFERTFHSRGIETRRAAYQKVA